jgi:hypothetical protein
VRQNGFHRRELAVLLCRSHELLYQRRVFAAFLSQQLSDTAWDLIKIYEEFLAVYSAQQFVVFLDATTQGAACPNVC